MNPEELRDLYASIDRHTAKKVLRLTMRISAAKFHLRISVDEMIRLSAALAVILSQKTT